MAMLRGGYFIEQVVGGRRIGDEAFEEERGRDALLCSTVPRDSPVVGRHWNWAAERPSSIQGARVLSVSLSLGKG